jgi:hypothetical protein
MNPIEVTVPSSIVPGQTISANVTLSAHLPQSSGPPAERATTGTVIHIYSSPSGVLVYDGTVSGNTASVPVPVSAGAPPGPVTVYLSADGSNVVTSTTTTVAQ